MVKHTGSSIILKVLKDWGIRYIFGGMGTDLLSFYDATSRDGRIKIIDPRHESNTVFAAMGYSAASGQPSICMVTGGPGATNLLTGIYAASREYAPIVCIAPFPFQGHDELRAFKGLDAGRTFAPVAKATMECSRIEQLQLTLQRAFRVATTPAFGPVFVGVWDRLFDWPVEEIPLVTEKWKPDSSLTYPDPDAISKAAKMLVEARNPIAFGDTRLMWNRSSPELQRLAECLGMPIICSVFTSMRPLVSASHPLYFGEYPSPITLALASESDVMLAIDCDFDTSVSMGFGSESGFSAKNFFPNSIVQIDTDSAHISKIYPISLGILGNSKVALRLLLEEVRKLGPKSGALQRRAESLKIRKLTWLQNLHREFRAARSKTPMSGLIPAAELGRLVDKDSIVSLSGSINAFYYNVLGVSLSATPGSTLFLGTDGALGGGIARAIGAKLASEKSRVVAYVGDGEFWYGGISELETISRLGLDITIIISNNGAQGDAKFLQKLKYGSRYAAVDMKNPDFARLAKCFGLRAERVEKPEEVGPALRRALSHRGAALVDIVTDWKKMPSYYEFGFTGDRDGLIAMAKRYRRRKGEK